MTMQFVAKYGVNTRLINAEPTEESILDAFRLKFPMVDPTDTFNIQAECLEIGPDTYLDIEDFSVLRDKQKLQFLVIQPVQPVQPVQPAQPVWHPQPLRMGQNDESLDENDENCEPTSGREMTGGKEIPFNFELPRFEFGLNHALSLGTPLTPKWEGRLVKALFDAMRVYVTDLYPTPIEYTRVCETLLRKYPHLRDTSTNHQLADRQASDPAYSWRLSLRNKFKYERRKCGDEAATQQMLAARAMYKSKNVNMNNNIPQDPTVMARNNSDRVRQQIAGERSRFGMGEGPDSTLQHQVAIQDEWKKRQPNLDVISARMEASKVNRLFEMRTESVKDVLEKYPNLSDPFQWLVEAERQMGVSIKANMETFFRQANLDSVLAQLVQSSNTHVKTFGSLKDYAERMGDGDAVITAKRTIIVACLPILCGDSMSKWIVIDKNVEVSGPIVHIQTSERAPGCLNGAKVTPYCDRHPLLDSAQETFSILDAFEVIAAAVYLFDVACDKTMIRSWRVLCEAMCGLPSDGKKFTGKMNRVLSAFN